MIKSNRSNITAEIPERDLKDVSDVTFVPWNRLAGKNIFITGATGLIGYNVVCALAYANAVKKLGMKIFALVRNKERALERFPSRVLKDDAFALVEGSVERLPEVDFPIDYVIHGASRTASKAFVEEPVETALTALQGTLNLLELAKKKNSEGITYLSSMEVYGHPPKGKKVTEKYAGGLSPSDVRNSYPISKLQCENLCHAYAREYGMNVTVARLTQTFGAGTGPNDNRVFAYFSDCVANKRDIVLKTKGDTERSYLYTADAVTAILTVLLKGEAGAAYNIADERTYRSISEIAEIIARKNGVRVRYDIQSEKENGYPEAVYMDLDVSALRSLGWYVASRNGNEFAETVTRFGENLSRG